MADAKQMAKLIVAAKKARENAYAPYSKYRVGAAIATKSGAVYTGCNVENASYGATICAERNAIGAMVAAGDDSPIACAVVTAGPKAAAPCGICRQVLYEFAPDMEIALVTAEGKRRDARLAELLPDGFLLKRRS
jgi:cytidine deaminase